MTTETCIISVMHRSWYRCGRIRLQGNTSRCTSPILLIFGYVVVDRKIRDTYFFISANSQV